MTFRINNTLIDNIPLIECYPSNEKNIKGVFFFIHGHTCSKELYYFGTLPERFTQMGFLVVLIDAYKHGERLEEPYLSGKDYEKTMAMTEVIDKTTKELASLYLNHYHQFAGKLGFLGISMGGHIVFQMPKYLNCIDYLIPIIGSPDLKRHYQEMKSIILGEERMMELDSILSLLSIDDNQYDQLTKMFILEGTEDAIVSFKNAYDFYVRMKSLGYSNIVYQDFPVGNTVTREMEESIENFVLKNL